MLLTHMLQLHGKERLQFLLINALKWGVYVDHSSSRAGHTYVVVFLSPGSQGEAQALGPWD